MLAVPTQRHTSELLHGKHHKVVLVQHVLHKEESEAAQWHFESSQHLIKLALTHQFHLKTSLTESLNSGKARNGWKCYFFG